MNSPDGSGEWGAVEAALERYFLARERGEAIDVKTACDGDVELAARVLAVLGEAPDMLVDAGDEPPGERPASFGDFDIVEEIGRGGMGTVYLALQRSLGREVALKVLDSGPKVMASARVRMRREAELTALLDHPNIVPVYAVGEVGEVPFIAMKYLVGPTLADADAPWQPEQVAQVGRSLAEALDAAHLQGVVHRDVKPANVIMDGDRPVFVDFGLARAQSDPTLTQEGKVAGTLRYMAPERLDTASPVLDPRADIYGLGATLYELLAGHEVFGDQSPTALVRSVLVRDPVPLRLRGRHHDLETIVMRALSKDPRKRFQSAREMADDLGRYLDGQPVTSRRVSAFERLWRQMRRYPRVSGALTAALLLVLASLTFLLVQQADAAADRGRRLAAARADLDAHRHRQALADLTRLRQAHAGDAEVDRTYLEARREAAIDRLLVMAVDHGDNIRSEDVEELLEVGAAAPGPRASLASLGAVVAMGQRGDRARAREQLAALPEPVRSTRCAAAVAAWLQDQQLPWPLPEAADDRDADFAMLTAVVLRTAGERTEQVLAELRDREAAVERAPRHVFLEAIAHLDAGRFDVAEGLLRGLASEHSLPAVWRWLAFAQMKLGRRELAEASLARATGDVSRLHDYLRLQLRAQREGVWRDPQTLLRLIDELTAKEPRSPAEEQFLAESIGMSDPSATEQAIERLQALVGATSSRIEAERLLALQVQMAGFHLPPDFGVEGAQQQHRAFVERWSPQVKQIRHRVSRSIAEMWLARSLVRTGSFSDLATGLDMFRDTAERWPESARLVTEYAEVCNHVGFARDDADRAVLRSHAMLARNAATMFLRRMERSGVMVASAQLDAVRYWEFVLSWQLQDVLGLADGLDAVEHILPEDFRQRVEPDAEISRRMLDEFRRR